MSPDQDDRKNSGRSLSETTKSSGVHNFVKMSVATIGVVFGDIGTSPLYAIRECFHGDYSIAVNRHNVLGVLSLMFWALTMIVTIKYLAFVLRADNKGEGGVIALTALLRPVRRARKFAGWTVVPLGLFAACLLYGDGMITPAISVLSAVEGLRIVTPFFSPYVVPITIVILGGLFLLQYRGTARVGSLFGPIILIWLCVLAFLGLFQIVKQPGVLVAVSPWHGINFLIRSKLHGFLVLGAVFLVVTGAEALYADMGHFGTRTIRSTWLCLVFPALVLNYFGQGALLLMRPEETHHPFYALVPPQALIPVVLLATSATIIASQAVITGSFSLTKQAIQLGYLPRLNITHTSASHIGQIYVAPVNWMLMVCTIGLVIGFQSSDRLAAAYGVAVTSTMLITTTLFFLVATQKWGWSKWTAVLLTGLFFLVDLPFFFANISKIFHGAWFPLAIGAFFFILMLTWAKGRRILSRQIKAITFSFDDFKRHLEMDPPQRVNGQAVFLTANPDVVPVAAVQTLKHTKVLHSDVAFLHIHTEDVPRVPSFEKIEAEKLGNHIYRLTAHYGFMEEPKIDSILSLSKEKGVDFNQENVSFFLGREKLWIGPEPTMSRWRASLFMFMARNSADAAAFFDIPSEQTIEVGVPLQL